MRDNIKVLSSISSFKCNYLSLHHQAVSRYSIELAGVLNLPTKTIEIIERAALLHDIGKIGIPNSILFRPDHLTTPEWNIMKLHPVTGSELLHSQNNINFGSEIIDAVRHHHEKWDGSGYPDGLYAEDIPLAARIIAVADAYDAMISDRPYRKALSKEYALNEIMNCSGKQFDPMIVAYFINSQRIKEKITLQG